MADSSGHRIARSRRELVELRLDDLFGHASPPRPPADVTTRVGDAGGSVERERWRDALVAEDDPHDDADEDDPFLVDAEAVPASGRSGGVPAAGAGRARDLVARWGQPGRWAQPGRWRTDPERRGALAVMAAILAAGVAVGWQALASRPHAESVAGTTGATAPFTTAPFTTGSFSSASITTPRSSASAGGAVTATTSAAKVIVDVVGRVHRPGLVTLPAGARVADAVRAAGGALAGTNLTSINLARVCVDGEQIAVGVTGAAAPGPGPASGTASGAAPGSGAPGGLINLNTATADQLDALPGVGPVMAQRIIAYRTDHGPFTAVTQLQQVSGIGDAKYADLRPLVTV